MNIKSGVRLLGLKPEMSLGILVINSIYNKFGLDATITAVTDGKHSHGSLHYAGCAVDIRTNDVPSDVLNNLVAAIKNSLSSEFDVVLENTHLHVEWQPK